MIGIYKITSPSGKIYIGQSTNILNRWKYYKNLDCKGQTRLYNSLNFYGIENHKFEIISLCYEEQLNEFERDFQDAYDVIGPNGLNCILVDTNSKSGKMSEEIKNKIRIKAIGRLHSQKTKDYLVLVNTGKKQSEETKLKISLANKGRIFSNDHKLKLSNNRKGIKFSNETLLKMSKSSRLSKPVICTETNLEWSSIKMAAIFNNINYNKLINMLNNKLTNTTTLKYKVNE